MLNPPVFKVFEKLTTAELLVSAFDILLVAFIIFRLLLMVRGTRGWRILLGVIVFVVAHFLSEQIGLITLHSLLDSAKLLGPVALVILFLPELRQALEGLTKLHLFPDSVIEAGHERNLDRFSVEEIVGAVSEMARDRVGAIIVIETGAHLEEIAQTGVMLNAKITTSLLGSVFYGQNPLHDGAVLIRGNNIYSAACRLPLSESQRIDKNLHMRHRAALGVTEQHDVIAIVVSEERGSIRVGREGKLIHISSSTDLREFLIEHTTRAEVDPESKRKSRRREKKEEAV